MKLSSNDKNLAWNYLFLNNVFHILIELHPQTKLACEDTQLIWCYWEGHFSKRTNHSKVKKCQNQWTIYEPSNWGSFQREYECFNKNIHKLIKKNQIRTMSTVPAYIGLGIIIGSPSFRIISTEQHKASCAPAVTIRNCLFQSWLPWVRSTKSFNFSINGWYLQKKNYISYMMNHMINTCMNQYPDWYMINRGIIKDKYYK